MASFEMGGLCFGADSVDLGSAHDSSHGEDDWRSSGILLTLMLLPLRRVGIVCIMTLL